MAKNLLFSGAGAAMHSCPAYISAFRGFFLPSPLRGKGVLQAFSSHETRQTNKAYDTTIAGIFIVAHAYCDRARFRPGLTWTRKSSTTTRKSSTTLNSERLQLLVYRLASSFCSFSAYWFWLFFCSCLLFNPPRLLPHLRPFLRR